MRFDGEKEDLNVIRVIAKRWGYGNAIQFLKMAWAKELNESCGMDRSTAAQGAFMRPGDGDFELFIKGKENLILE